MEKHTVAITIRSFDLHGPAMAHLLGHCRIVYTNTSGLRLSEETLAQALRGAEIALAGTEPFTESVIEAADRLRIISRVGTGTDSIDLDAAGKTGILVLTTPDAPVQAVAEHTLALLLAVLKQIPQYNDALRRGISMTRPGSLLAGKHIGVIGLGRIGTRVADMLESLGCSIAYYDPFVKEPARRTWQKRETLPDLVAGADILTLHAPAQAERRPLLDAAVLGSCKKGIIIINSARGSLINEDAMISALEDGTIAGAGLDVFPSEPYTGPLLSYPQVIATPHVASHTLETRTLMEQEAVEKVISALTGGRK
jgi:D-3-phosphoglycerate dehydrogenase